MLARPLQIIQYALAAIGVIGIMVSLINNDLIGIIESIVIIVMATILGFLDHRFQKKRDTKNK